MTLQAAMGIKKDIDNSGFNFIKTIRIYKSLYMVFVKTLYF